MAGQTMLTWRKYPRDTITNPALRFIIRKLAPERQHTVFTLVTALYCQADDQGCVDVSDPEVFADLCMLDTVADLHDLLDRFVQRDILQKQAPEVPVYYIVGWNEPYPSYGTASPTAGSWDTRKTSLQDRFETRSAVGQRSPGSPSAAAADLAAAALAPPAASTQPPAAPDQDASKTAISDMSAALEALMAADVLSSAQNDKNGENVSLKSRETKNEKMSHRQIREDKTREIKKERKRRTHTQERENPLAPAAVVGQSPPSGGHGAAPGASEAEETRGHRADTREPEEGEHTEEKDQGNGEHTEEKAETVEPERPTDERDTRGENESTTSDAEPTGETVLEDGCGKGNGDRGVSREPSHAELFPTYKALWTYFERNNPGGYPNEKQEREAATELARRVFPLGDARNPSQIVACQFVGAFMSLIKLGGYYDGMPCTPSMLLKPGNYAKVFAKTQKILHPKEDGGSPWHREWNRAAEEARLDAEEHDPRRSTAREYEKYGISPDDPNRVMKLMAAKNYSEPKEA